MSLPPSPQRRARPATIYFLALVFCLADCVFAATRSAAASAPAIPSPSPLKPIPDVDALAKRMKIDGAIYAKMRDQALAAYREFNPQPASHDIEANDTLRLLCYLSVWTDYYGEGLWVQCKRHVDHLQSAFPGSEIFPRMMDTHLFLQLHSASEDHAYEMTREIVVLEKSHYPALFRVRLCRLAMGNLFASVDNGTIQPATSKAYQLLPQLIDLAGDSYADMLRDRYPEDLEFRAAEDLFKACYLDPKTMTALNDKIQAAFSSVDRDNPLAQAVAADYHVQFGWAARGTGYADTVSADGWNVLGVHLDMASVILTKLYAEHPENPTTPTVMMRVVLGQQQSRNEMERWFARGVDLNPDSFALYMDKRMYLLPRWYGSDDAVWQYGLECAASSDWQDKIPFMLVECIDDAGSRDPSVYARPDVWVPLEKVFRGYLEHFPNAVIVRSRFVKCAIGGARMDVAAQQLQLLGDEWDRSILSQNDYDTVRKVIEAAK